MKKTQKSAIRNINYRTDINRFANRCLLSSTVLNETVLLIAGEQLLDVDSLLRLAVVAEAVVLNESVIIEDADTIVDAFDSQDIDSLESGATELIGTLAKVGTFEGMNGDSADSILVDEVAPLVYPQISQVKVHTVHGSHIIIEQTPDEEALEDGWSLAAEKNFSPEYKQLLKRYGYYESDWFSADRLAHPWQILADCHGIPYITDCFYSVRDVSIKHPTNIGLDLYKRLEKLHREYFRNIRRYLGPTYVYIPPILSIVLSHCKTVEDIPVALAETRLKYENFRKTCTSLEIELRKAPKLLDQIEIIHEIENIYQSLATRASAPKTRLLLKLFDILKEIDPISMSSTALGQAKDYFVEKEGLLKIPGYYDLWKSSLEVEQVLPKLQKLFRGQVTSKFISDLNSIQALIQNI